MTHTWTIRHQVFLFSMIALPIVLMGQGCVSLGGGGKTNSGPAGMFVSSDKGENWKQISQLPTLEGVKTLSSASVYRLVNDPGDPKAMYWLTRNEGLLYSYDEGRSWRTVEGPLSKGFVYAFAVHPKDRCTMFGTSGSEVYLSTDCTRSWKEVYREARANARIVALTFNPFSPHHMFMATSNGDLLESLDSGVSWSVVRRFNAQVAQIEADPHQEGLIYVASRSKGLFRSFDGGATWTDLEDALDNFSDAIEYRRFFLHPTISQTIYWISTYGILVSDDGGDSWAAMELITPPGSAQIYAFAINPANDDEIYYTATINGRSTLYKSADGGTRWVTERLPSRQLPTMLRVHPTDGNMLYLGFTIPPKPKNSGFGQIPTR